MPKPRKALVSLEATSYYHCVFRCVRRAFLCGEDTHSGQSYEHRREWIQKRMLSLGKVFAFTVCAYAVMSNHYHVVLHVDREQVESWEDRVVMALHGATLREPLQGAGRICLQTQSSLRISGLSANAKPFGMQSYKGSVPGTDPLCCS